MRSLQQNNIILIYINYDANHPESNGKGIR